MRTFRALINNKGGDPYIQPNLYPFGTGKNQYQIPAGHRVERSLRIADIRRIETFEATDKRLLIARDIFMFMFYCSGINIGDLFRLQYSDIDTYNNEIIFKRKKTAKKVPQPVQTPLLTPMVRIIEKWGNKDRSGYIFPFLNECKTEEERVKKISLERSNINTWVKKIGEALSLPDISTGTARNSYATYLLSEGISRVFVDKQLGHYNRGDVLSGYANFTPEQRLQYNSLLMNETDGNSKVIAMSAI